MNFNSCSNSDLCMCKYIIKYIYLIPIFIYFIIKNKSKFNLFFIFFVFMKK